MNRLQSLSKEIVERDPDGLDPGIEPDLIDLRVPVLRLNRRLAALLARKTETDDAEEDRPPP